MNIVPIIILFFGGVILTIGDIVFKYWIEKGAINFSFLHVIGVLMYIVGSLLLVESYKHDINVAGAGVIQVIFNVIILLVCSYFIFQEPASAKQIVGIVLGIAAIYLLA